MTKLSVEAMIDKAIAEQRVAERQIMEAISKAMKERRMVDRRAVYHSCNPQCRGVDGGGDQQDEAIGYDKWRER